MIDVNEHNFEQEVVQASFVHPVLVDLWAPWCGPCRMLGPVLEKLAQSLAGQITLVKVNSDDNPQLSARFKVRSIPMVLLFREGQVVDSFLGAKPEGAIRAFLEPHLPKPGDESLREARVSARDGQLESAAGHYATTLAINPAQDGARAEYVRVLLSLERTHEARTAYEPLRGPARSDLALAALGQLVDASLASATPDAEQGLRTALAADPESLELRFQLAQVLMAASRWQDCMDELLIIIARDRGFREDAARKTMLAVFELCGDPALVGAYRRKLSAGLY